MKEVSQGLSSSIEFASFAGLRSASCEKYACTVTTLQWDQQSEALVIVASAAAAHIRPNHGPAEFDIVYHESFVTLLTIFPVATDSHRPKHVPNFLTSQLCNQSCGILVASVSRELYSDASVNVFRANVKQPKPHRPHSKSQPAQSRPVSMPFSRLSSIVSHLATPVP